MSQKLCNIRKRLAKVQQQIADIARHEELSNCNCRDGTVASEGQAEEFEREMNLPCPTHGLRRRGTIIHFIGVGDPLPPENIAETPALEEPIAEEEPLPAANTSPEGRWQTRPTVRDIQGPCCRG
jgi:hypothetical protein